MIPVAFPVVTASYLDTNSIYYQSFPTNISNTKYILSNCSNSRTEIDFPLAYF